MKTIAIISDGAPFRVPDNNGFQFWKGLRFLILPSKYWLHQCSGPTEVNVNFWR